MIESLSLILAWVTGVILGMLFFGGLWWTVQKGLPSERSAFWFFASLVMRTSVVLVGFYLIGQGHWERLPVCLLGFVVARLIVIRLTRIPGISPLCAKGVDHAP
jgi:F1F0 ATPase subunit 2